MARLRGPHWSDPFVLLSKEEIEKKALEVAKLYEAERDFEVKSAIRKLEIEAEKKVDPEKHPPFVSEVSDKKPRAKHVRMASEADVESFVLSVLRDYPGVFEECSHYTMTLLKIINVINYEPDSSLYANKSSIKKDSDALKALHIVNRHLSIPMLNDLREHLSLASGAGVISKKDTYETVETVIESSFKSDDPNWGSW